MRHLAVGNKLNRAVVIAELLLGDDVRIVPVDGQCSFYDFLAHFGLEDVYSSAEYNTISGLILDELEHIPHSGEYLQWECFRLEVVDMDGARIDKVLATMIDTSDNKNK